MKHLLLSTLLLLLVACSPEEEVASLNPPGYELDAAAAGPSAGLFYSFYSDAREPRSLTDATVADSLYVWLESEAPIVQVRFTVDTPPVSERVERYLPYSLGGDRGVGRLFPYDFSQLSPGVHTVVAEVLFEGQETAQPVTASFTVEETITYQEPIVITQGGTYRGNWRSYDPEVPAVEVKTTEPVVIENTTVRGPGNLIYLRPGYASNVTIRNVRGYGENPNVVSQRTGRFIAAYHCQWLSVEHCYLEGTGGILLYDAQDGATVKIRYNQARNIDGRLSDGNNGYLIDKPRIKDYAQFVQLDICDELVDAEVAWNQVINDPFKSRPEDNINTYKSNGTPGSPLLIHNNYVQGAYPNDPTNTPFYSGGGIILGDGGGSYQRAYDNQVVATTNYAVSIAGGQDNAFYRNRAVSSGYLPDGRYIAAQNVGMYIWNQYDPPFGQAKAYDNVSGWVKSPDGTRRNDYWIKDTDGQREAALWENNRSIEGPITQNTEQAEWTSWQEKLRQTGVTVGPKQ